MTKFTRHVNAIKEKIAKLGDELFSFLSLMILSSVEALFLFLFVRVHESVHDHLDHSPLCPLKVAIIVMGLSFLTLNVVIVLAFVTNHIVATISSLRSALTKKPQERRTKQKRRSRVAPSRKREDRQSSPTPREAGSKSVSITVVRGADEVRVSSVTSPSPRGKSVIYKERPTPTNNSRPIRA